MDCPFCNPPRDRVFYEDELVLGLWDAYPVSEGHALVITRRHVAFTVEETAYEPQQSFCQLIRS
jgi:diadenosine tetraphosphate (Ap4A) HIT family hydrolase